jgi:hypothetical protein
MDDGLDQEVPAPRRRLRLPWGFLGMLGLVIAVEARLGTHDLDFTAPWHWDWRDLGRRATRPEVVGDRQVLCFGDSMVKFGVMPSVIRREAGKSAYNFAVHTGQTSSSYFLLKRALDAGARPSAIVLNTTPHMLIHPPAQNRMLWPEMLTPGECLDLARTMRDPNFATAILLAELLPSYKERHDLRANLKAALEGRSTSRRSEIPSYRRNWVVNEGAQLLIDSGPPAVPVSEWVDGLYSRWAPDGTNLTYLHRFFDLAESRGIPVYWLIAPAHPEVQAGVDRNRFDLDHSIFVLEMQKRHPNAIVVDARHSGFTADLFADGAHLNRRGALKLSSALAAVLRDPPPTDPTRRWVALDLGRAREFDRPIEDVGQSGVALRAVGEGTARR